MSKCEHIRFRLIGNVKFWTEEIRELSEQVMNLCPQYYMTVNLLIGYNPFDEIKEAGIDRISDLSMDDLSIPEKVDIIFRTAGTPTRLSNFLPLQSGYAAIHTFDSLFLDIPIEEYCLQWSKYSEIQMRYVRYLLLYLREATPINGAASLK